ncbi:MAG: IS21-like element helper ATPase IstB [Methyloprofundus sp.]|nr:IS21-like element helper ATPase IstB [Methyloprofundus sp.]
MKSQTEQLKERAKTLKLYGLIARWDELLEPDFNWVERLLQWEETQRNYRSLERRLSSAKLGRFKMLADFDWDWLTQCDRGAVEDLMKLSFLNDATNAIFVGPNGVGKTTIAKNIAHTAVLKGKKVLFTTAAKMLNELAAYDGDIALQRRLRHYCAPDALVIDEVGYLSYGNRHADLLFEIINRRYEQKSTLITTNRPFSEWGEVFPGAACVVSLIDRLIHHAEIIAFEGESYRLKEAKERSELRKKKRNGKKNND